MFNAEAPEKHTLIYFFESTLITHMKNTLTLLNYEKCKKERYKFEHNYTRASNHLITLIL